MTLTTYPRRYLDNVSKVKGGFRRGSDSCFVMTYIFRPLSFLVTPAVVGLGVSANGVTILGGILAILSLALFASGDFLFWTLGLALFNAYLLLDAVDGNVARITDSASYFGKFLDGAIDTLAFSLLPVCIGWGQYMETNEVLWFALGSTSGIVMLYSLYTMTRLSFHREWLRTDFLQSRLPDAVSPDFDGASSKPLFSISPLINYIFAMLIIASVFDIRQFFVVGYTGFAVAWGVTVLWSQHKAARIMLNIHRKSRHTVDQKSNIRDQH